MSEHDFFTDMSTINDGSYLYLTLLKTDMLIKFDRICEEASRSNKRVNASWVARTLGLPPAARHEITRFLDRTKTPRRTAKKPVIDFKWFFADPSEIQKPIEPQKPIVFPFVAVLDVTTNQVIYASAIMTKGE